MTLAAAPRTVARHARAVARALGAAACAMFGVRRRNSAETDHCVFGPVHAVVAGILLLAVFVATLLAVVAVVTRAAGS